MTRVRQFAQTRHQTSLPISIASHSDLRGVSAAAQRAHSCPEVDTLALFDCSASQSNESSVECSTSRSNESIDHGERTAGGFHGNPTQEEVTNNGSECGRRRCEHSSDFSQLFAFLDDAHRLGYAVENKTFCAGDSGHWVRPRRKERSVRLCTPSFERCHSNSPLLAHRAFRYASSDTRARSNAR